MRHYAHHIGDWTAATVHLSDVEEVIYLRLISAYYLREAPLPNEPAMLIRFARAYTPTARRAVYTVLAEFFKLGDDDCWHQKRCDAELDAWYKKSAAARSAIEFRWERHRQANVESKQQRADTDVPTLVHTDVIPPITHYPEPPPLSLQKDVEREPTPPRKIATAHGTRLPTDWSLPDQWADFARSDRPDWDEARLIRTSLEFRDYWLGKAGQLARKADWFATWRNWVRREDDKTKPKVNGHAPDPGWWTSNDATLAKAAELGLSSRGGESWHDLRQRIRHAESQRH